MIHERRPTAGDVDLPVRTDVLACCLQFLPQQCMSAFGEEVHLGGFAVTPDADVSEEPQETLTF